MTAPASSDGPTMEAVLRERLTKATTDRDACLQRRQQLTAAREQVTAAANAAQGRIDELTELLALVSAVGTT